MPAASRLSCCGEPSSSRSVLSWHDPADPGPPACHQLLTMVSWCPARTHMSSVRTDHAPILFYSTGARTQVDKAQRMLHEVRHLEYQSAAVRGARPFLKESVVPSRVHPCCNAGEATSGLGMH